MRHQRLLHPSHTQRWRWVTRLDPPLLLLLGCLSGIGLFVLYSAGGANLDNIGRQSLRLMIGALLMLICSQITPAQLRHWTPWLFVGGISILLLVLLFGSSGKGAQRWLELGIVRFQPAELMKLAVPMMVAFYLHDKRPQPSLTHCLLTLALIALPTVLIAKQPDLGTALLVAGSGLTVLFLSGIQWRLLVGLVCSGIALLPLLWHFLHPYQKQRILTFLNPESDPLGSGYHVIQSTIAIGSGGLYGKGWLQGTQSHLNFLPEQSTDFIFSVYAEEFGLFGSAVLMLLYLLLIGRGLFIASEASHHYSRLLAGAISVTCFVYVLVNIGMVSGLLPIVGVPLPLISYGGSSIATLGASFGILMAIQADRPLIHK